MIWLYFTHYIVHTTLLTISQSRDISLKSPEKKNVHVRKAQVLYLAEEKYI